MSAIPSDGWYYGTIPSDRRGPVSLAQLQQLVHDKVVTPTTLVWAEGVPRWIPAYELPALNLRAPGDVATGLLLPTGPQSAWAIAAGYCGLLFFIPFLGVLGIVFGLLGWRDLVANRGKRGWGRVWTGLALGALGTFGWLAISLGWLH